MKINRRKFMAYAGVSAAVLSMPNWALSQSKVVFDNLNILLNKCGLEQINIE